MNKTKNSPIKIIDLSSFIIVATCFALWLAVFFEKGIEDFLAYILILTFGILHGANDIKLIQKTNTAIHTRLGFITTLIYYVLFVGASVLFFFFLPSVALVLFILFSGYHFGEQHWVSKTKKTSIFNSLLYISYGLLILFLIFYAHGPEVSLIIEEICDYKPSIPYYRYGVILFGLLSFLLGTLCYLKKNMIFNFPKQIFYLIVLYIVFNTASLLWAFAIYFILWHSLPSMVDQILYLYGNVKLKSIKKYVWSSIPYWAISVIGIGSILFLFKGAVNTSLALFFSFLAAITFPHVLVIKRLNKK